MKPIFIILSFLFILSSCKVPVYTIGMNEKDFTSSYKLSLELVEATQHRTVYKRPARIAYGSTPAADMYYYFEDGILVRMQLIEQRPPVIIEHRKSDQG